MADGRLKPKPLEMVVIGHHHFDFVSHCRILEDLVERPLVHTVDVRVEQTYFRRGTQLPTDCPEMEGIVEIQHEIARVLFEDEVVVMRCQRQAGRLFGANLGRGAPRGGRRLRPRCAPLPPPTSGEPPEALVEEAGELVAGLLGFLPQIPGGEVKLAAPRQPPVVLPQAMVTVATGSEPKGRFLLRREKLQAADPFRLPELAQEALMLQKMGTPQPPRDAIRMGAPAHQTVGKPRHQVAFLDLGDQQAAKKVPVAEKLQTFIHWPGIVQRGRREDQPRRNGCAVRQMGAQVMGGRDVRRLGDAGPIDLLTEGSDVLEEHLQPGRGRERGELGFQGIAAQQVVAVQNAEPASPGTGQPLVGIGRLVEPGTGKDVVRLQPRFLGELAGGTPNRFPVVLVRRIVAENDLKIAERLPGKAGQGFSQQRHAPRGGNDHGHRHGGERLSGDCRLQGGLFGDTEGPLRQHPNSPEPEINTPRCRQTRDA